MPPAPSAGPRGLLGVPDAEVIAVVAVLSALAGFVAGLVVGILLMRRRISAKHRGKYPWR